MKTIEQKLFKAHELLKEALFYLDPNGHAHFINNLMEAQNRPKWKGAVVDAAKNKIS